MSDVAEASFIPGHRRSVSERVMVTVRRTDAPSGRVPVTLVLTDKATHAPLARFETYFWGPEGAP
jgi:hypothetical protein